MKRIVCSTDEIVKRVIFCYTMDTNKLYDTKTNPSFCYCCLCIFYDCATTVVVQQRFDLQATSATSSVGGPQSSRDHADLDVEVHPSAEC